MSYNPRPADAIARDLLVPLGHPEFRDRDPLGVLAELKARRRGVA